MASHRVIPSIEQLLQRPALTGAVRDHGRAVVTGAVRQAAAELRSSFSGGDARHRSPTLRRGSRRARSPLRRAQTLVIARGGDQCHRRRPPHEPGPRAAGRKRRSPRAARWRPRYTNLEYDLERGTRGHRHAHAERLLCTLTGADRAIVVNNAAAAALLALSALASGREVIVSRGELVEIGGGFRVPEVLAQSGAVLREVGTTNRTRVSDYAAAISDRTAAILRVHPSNFHIEGFTERPELQELAALAARFGIPLIEDLGSGWLGLDRRAARRRRDPRSATSLAAGVNLVVFSGDKLLGGPQAGIVVGREDLVATLAAHPLMRALRVDKMTYAALEATLQLWAGDESRQSIPIVRMLAATKSEHRRARTGDRPRPCRRVRAFGPRHRRPLHDWRRKCAGLDTPHGLARARVRRGSCRRRLLAARLRGSPAARDCADENDRVVLDLRTVRPIRTTTVIQALQTVAQAGD